MPVAKKTWTKAQYVKLQGLLNKHKGHFDKACREMGVDPMTARARIIEAPKSMVFPRMKDFKVISAGEWNNIVAMLTEHKGNRSIVGKQLGYSETNFRRMLDTAPKWVKLPKPEAAGRSDAMSVEDMETAWATYERYGYIAASAAEALGVPISTISQRVKAAQHRLGKEKRHLGQLNAADAKKIALPKKGEVKYYMFSTAQNNTLCPDDFWESSMQLAEFYDAEIKIASLTYKPNLHNGSQKRTAKSKTPQNDTWYDPRVVPFLSDEFELIAPGLVWCGHHNTLPTAADPLRGTESLNGRASGIFPHPRIEMRPIATAEADKTKFNFTTGACTLRNYIQKRVGITAEFYHCFGWLLIAVDSAGNWWPRQLNADSDGTIYDLDIYSTPEGVFESEGVEGIKFGDIHKDSIDEVIEEATWGAGGMVEVLKPKHQFLDDLMNLNAGHHARKDPHVMFELNHTGLNVVWDEVKRAGNFVDKVQAAAPESVVIITDSNHTRHFDRFLKEVRWDQDLVNAETLLAANLAWVRAIKDGLGHEFVPMEWCWKEMGIAAHAHVMNVRSDDPTKLSWVLCPAYGDGVEMALHGDLGPNGARGGPRNLSKLGRKNVIGHSHSPGIYGGTYVTGVTGKLRQGYNVGPSSWAHAHCVVYPNGKRAIILFWNGQPWEQRG